jgi:ABC-2 type transport system permease protein
MTIRRGETLLLTIGIPVIVLIFFSVTHLSVGGTRTSVSFVAPGVLALGVMSTSLVSLSISTGFERTYGVLRRLHTTPLGRGRLIVAKIASVLITEALQCVVVATVALLLGWHPHVSVGGVFVAVFALVGGSIGCAGIGLAMAGALAAEVNLAAANGLYLVLLLFSGIVVPLTSLPAMIGRLATALPPGAMADSLHRLLTNGHALAGGDVAALLAWAVVAPVLAAKTFRFD